MKIGIVNDMLMAVEALRRAVALNPVHRVIWTARSGAEAVEKCAQERPDLVLMDLLMPGMDGVEATKRIMAATPCAILVVTASTGANSWRVFEAMGHGALDAVDTPVLTGGDPRTKAEPLLAKIESIRRLLRERELSGGPRGSMPPFSERDSRRGLVVIGASAGGPAALATVLQNLPADFRVPVVIVQHVDKQFAPGMADWLGQTSKLPVRLAVDGDRPTPGVVLLAGTNDHLVLTADGSLKYTPDPVDYVYRPSVDVFFQSVASYWRGTGVAVLLTGMGRDGAVGMKVLRNQGLHTIAQDEATCAVYGMPRAAVTLDAVAEILPLSQIARNLARAVAACSRSNPQT